MSDNPSTWRDSSLQVTSILIMSWPNRMQSVFQLWIRVRIQTFCCWKKLQSSEPLHTKMHLILLLVGITGSRVTNRNLFRTNRSPKMRESQQLVFGLRLVSKEFQHFAIQTRIVLHFGGFFHQIKVRRGTNSNASACCKAGPSSNLGSAPQRRPSTERKR